MGIKTIWVEIVFRMFSELSIKLTKDISKDEKKQFGIFFTPPTYCSALLQRVGNLSPACVLEPSFGSGEFLVAARHAYPTASITGVELNNRVFEEASRKFKEDPDTHLVQQDFLKFYDGQYDLIIGNPPYVVVDKASVPEDLSLVSQGRPNLFCLFLYHCVKNLLRDGGCLAFVLPTSILNCAYYDNLRKYLARNTTIKDIVRFDDNAFLETGQDTLGLILEKTPGQGDFIVPVADRVLFSPDYVFINREIAENQSLFQAGYRVKTGTIVWNQHKDKLTRDPMHPVLVYYHNLKEGGVVLDEENAKPQFISCVKEALRGPVIFVGRGYGNTAYNLKVCYVPDLIDGKPFFAENHLNTIVAVTPEALQRMPELYKSLTSPRTAKFIRTFVGNGALSKSEIERVIPFYPST